jgi:hypothetical protein
MMRCLASLDRSNRSVHPLSGITRIICSLLIGKNCGVEARLLQVAVFKFTLGVLKTFESISPKHQAFPPVDPLSAAIIASV